MSESDQPDDVEVNLPIIATPVASAPSVGALVDSWISKVPAIYHKSTLKAALKLVHGAVDVGVAWTETKAREIRSVQKAREETRKSLVKASVKQIESDPEIGKRAAEYFVTEQIGKQANREAVMKLTFEQLSSEPFTSGEAVKESEPLDDNWLGGFSRYAENATTERARELFAKVLAGEIRRPGDFSLFTLDFLGKMGKREAELIATLAPFVIEGIMIRTNYTNSVFNWSLASQLGSMNILTSTSIGAMSASSTHPMIVPNVAPNGFAALLFGSRQVLILGSPQKKEVTINCSVLTPLGIELMKLYEVSLDGKMLKEFAALVPNDVGVFLADLKQEKGKVSWSNMEVINP